MIKQKIEKRLGEPERVVGKKTSENELLKDAVNLAQEKTHISQQPLPEMENFRSAQ